MDLSIIIINYNTYELTCNCIASIYTHTKDLEFEVILVDNNSKTFDKLDFKSRFPAVLTLLQYTNIGFGAANNLAMKQARGRYLLLLNSDTLILDNSIERCYQFLESKKAADLNVVLLGCKLLNPDGSYQLSVFPYLRNSLGIYLKTIHPLFEKWSSWRGTNKHQSFNPNELQKVGDVSGAFMFLKRSIAELSGYFDTNFFMYCEDTEWCQDRLSKLGQIFYFPDAAIMHYGGQSAPQGLMYIQAKLSLSLMWYKRGIIQYIGYVIISYGTLLSTVPMFIFFSSETRRNIARYIKTYIKLLPYILFRIPKFVSSRNKDKKLIYHRIKKVLL